MPSSTPQVSSFLIADSVFQQASGKWCIVGTFTGIWARTYPVIHPSLGLYLKLADAEGEYALRVEFQDADGVCLGKLAGVKLTVKSRLTVAEVGMQGDNLLLPKPGVYFLKLFINEEPANIDIKIRAAKLEEQT